MPMFIITAVTFVFVQMRHLSNLLFGAQEKNVGDFSMNKRKMNTLQ